MAITRAKSSFTRRGSALLAVLWITAALAAIAFSLSNTVRGETERTSTELDDVRSYYLAAGALDRAMLELIWSAVYPDKRMLPRGVTTVDYRFLTGVARVEIIPETAKLDLNTASPALLYRLMEALGIAPNQAQEIAAAIADWRSPGGTLFDPYYLSRTPSFQASHASFQETEELLLVKGVTPEIFYGTYVPAPGNGSAANGGPRLIRRSGLVDCLSTFGASERVDANTANPAVLAALGLSPDAVNALVQLRRVKPLDAAQLGALAPGLGPGAAHLRVEGNSIITLRATAQALYPDGKLSDLKRTVAAQVKYMPAGYESVIHILRWYDTTWSN